MTGTRVLRGMGLALLVATGAGCDPTGPSTGITGTYVLTAIDGVGSPLVVVDHTFSSGDRLLLRVVADSMTFTSDSTIQRSQVRESTTYRADGSVIGPHESADGYPGLYHREGDRLIVAWRSQVNPGVAGVDTLRIDPDRLTATRPIGLWCAEGCPEPRRAPFVYERR